MEQSTVAKVIFLSIFLTTIVETIASAQQPYFQNYGYVLPSHHRARQSKNVRFGYQNPLLSAPTLASPQTDSFESESQENPITIKPFNEPPWTPGFTYPRPAPSRTTTPRFSSWSSSPILTQHNRRCPFGYVQGWDGEGCIPLQTTTTPRPPTTFADNYRTVTKYYCPVGQIATRPYGQCVPTTTTPRSRRPPTFNDNYRTVTKYYCPVGQIATRPYGQCIPTTTAKSDDASGSGYHVVVKNPILVTTRKPKYYPQDSSPTTTVRYGHQNPIFVAPTLQPRPDYSPDYPPSSPTPSSGWESSTKPTVLSPCDKGSVNHRLDPKTNRCFALGSVEPCGGGRGHDERNLAFYAHESDPIYGTCECILGSSRPLVYHKETDTCYFIYQQAYCEEQQWLTLNDNGNPNCTHNPCYNYGQMDFDWDWKRNSNSTYMNTEGIVPVYEVEKCVPLGQICHRLPNGTLTFADATDPTQDFSQYQTSLMFQPGSLQPTCHTHNNNNNPPNNSHQNILPTKCRPGSKSNILNLCQVTIESRMSDSKADALVNTNSEVSSSSKTKRTTNLIFLLTFFMFKFL